MKLCKFLLLNSLIFPLITAQGPSAGVYGQINLPELLRSLQGAPTSQYLQAIYPTWQLPSPYRYTPYDSYGWGNNRYYPLPYSPYSYPDYGNNIQPQGNRGPMDMQDLIGDLSLSLMRSFTNLLGGNNSPNPPGNSIAPLNRQPYLPPYTPPDLYGFGSNGPSSSYGYHPAGRYNPANYGGNSQSAYSSSPSSNFPFAQPPSLPYPPGKSQSEFGYGVNAGVYAGTYGGNSVVGPMGPYGPVNNNVGSSYGGLSPWPLNPGNYWGPQRPQPIVPVNNGSNNPSGGRVPGVGPQQQTPSPVQTGTGSVVQIPLTEGLSGPNLAANGGAELLMPVTPQQV